MSSKIIQTALLAAGLMLLSATQAALAGDQYGAIAYDLENGAYGYAVQYHTRKDAEQMALQHCWEALDGKDGECAVELWFKNSYGALAEGDNGFGTGWGNNKNEAQYQAMKVCERHTANCDITITVASE